MLLFTFSNFSFHETVDIFFVSIYGRSMRWFFERAVHDPVSRSRGRPHPSLFKFTACRFKLVVDRGTINVLWGVGYAAKGVVGGVGTVPGSHEGPLGAIARPYGWDKCSGRFK